MSAILAILLWTLAATPASVPVVAEARPDGAVVTWQAPPGTALACVIVHNRLVGCGDGRLRQGPGSIDASLRLRPGDVVEVRAWDAEGQIVGQGWATVAWRVWVPRVANVADGVADQRKNGP